MSEDYLNRPGWVTPQTADGYPKPFGREAIQWAVLVRPWGDPQVCSVGPFDSWNEAEAWAEEFAIEREAIILGICEMRRPKGTNDMTPRRKPRT